MGNKCCPTSIKILDCIHQLQEVENTLQQLIHKYDTQILQEKKKILPKIRDKSACMVHLRTIHIIKHHKNNLEHRLTTCMQKRYHLESLNVTKMQIKAVKTTTNAFKSFLQQHDIDRIEALQENITGMIDQACEINEVLTRNVTDLDFDESDLESEYQELILQPQEFPVYPILPEVPTTNPNHPLLDQKIEMGQKIEMVPVSI